MDISAAWSYPISNTVYGARISFDGFVKTLDYVDFLNTTQLKTGKIIRLDLLEYISFKKTF
ncbi:MAG: hypothetical protein AAF217_10820 [Pseudomonadota bacterium]